MWAASGGGLSGILGEWNYVWVPHSEFFMGPEEGCILSAIHLDSTVLKSTLPATNDPPRCFKFLQVESRFQVKTLSPC